MEGMLIMRIRCEFNFALIALLSVLNSDKLKICENEEMKKKTVLQSGWNGLRSRFLRRFKPVRTRSISEQRTSQAQLKTS